MITNPRAWYRTVILEALEASILSLVISQCAVHAAASNTEIWSGFGHHLNVGMVNKVLKEGYGGITDLYAGSYNVATKEFAIS